MKSVMPQPAIRRLSRIAAMVGVCLAGVAGAASPAAAASGGAKQDCVYTAHLISRLDAFESLVGRNLDCASVYNDASNTWSKWENPWFINYADPDSDWSQWATVPGANRQLII